MKRILLAGIFVLSTAMAQAGGLVPYRAQYDVSLAHTRPGGMITARGRTVVEFRDACTAWTMSQRFITDMTNAKAEYFRSDFYVSSSETKDGRMMRFKLRDAVNGKVTQRVDGTGTLASIGGQVKLTAPRGGSFELPVGTAMPTQFTLALLNAAENGTSRVRQTVFQGGDSTNLYDAVATIGKPVSVMRLGDDSAADASGLLKGHRAWPAIISYYPHDADEKPADYEMAYRLYDNGVISQMSLIYPNFTLRADLVKLERLPGSC
jgi:EipB-like